MWRKNQNHCKLKIANFKLQIVLFLSLSSLCPLWQIRSEEVNLLKNGGFEEGDKDPKFWDRLDGLTMFWKKTNCAVANACACTRASTTTNTRSARTR